MSAAVFVEHRRRLFEHLRTTHTAALVFAASPKYRNNDSEFRYRPDSDFFWCTGFDEAHAALLLLPGRQAGESVLFLRDRVPAEERWEGPRLGVARAPETLLVDEARPIEQLWESLGSLLRGYERVLYRTGVDEERDRRLLALCSRMGRDALASEDPDGAAPRDWIDPAHSLHELRLFKGPEELHRMRRAAAISAEAHVLCMQMARGGSSEAELDGLLEYTFRRRGGSGAAYTSIVAGGPRACVLHYTANRAPLAEGELVLIDAGAEYGWYASDVSRTFPVGGRFSAPQRALYELVLAAQEAAIAAVRPGTTVASVHTTAVRVLAAGLLDLGLLQGSLEEVVEQRTYTRFFMHGTGHWLGLDVHDVGLYTEPDGSSRRLLPGMVTTVEPGLYVSADDTSVAPHWRGIGIRIEDDVLVTPEGNEVLSRATPKSVADVEAASGG
ncbi:MAG: M24 family metallopeptidase [Planctomycetaceae bacterium]|nr:M24 family metallopeptidase [Planctomycetaceae bacterium]